MPVVFQAGAVRHGTASVANASLAVTCTPGGILLVGLATCAANSTISSVAANGNALTRLAMVNKGAAGLLEVWALTSPPAGTLSISYNVAAGALRLVAVQAGIWAGQRTSGIPPFGTVATGTATGANVNFSVSSSFGNVIANFFAAATAVAITSTQVNGLVRGTCTASTSARMMLVSMSQGTITASVSAATSTTWGWIGVPIRDSSTAIASDAIVQFRSMRGMGF